MFEELIAYYDTHLAGDVPLCTSPAKAFISIVIDYDGRFVSSFCTQPTRVHIPTTIKSENRTSNIVPYPFVDKLAYLENKSLIKCVEELNTLGYGTKKSKAWEEYLKNGNVRKDIEAAQKEYGNTYFKADDLLPEVFIIDDNGEASPLLDDALYRGYERYYDDMIKREECEFETCLISGNKCYCTTFKMPKIFEDRIMAKIFSNYEIFTIDVYAKFKIEHSLRDLMQHHCVQIGSVYTIVFCNDINVPHFMDLGGRILPDTVSKDDYQKKVNIICFNAFSNFNIHLIKNEFLFYGDYIKQLCVWGNTSIKKYIFYTKIKNIRNIENFINNFLYQRLFIDDILKLIENRGAKDYDLYIKELIALNKRILQIKKIKRKNKARMVNKLLEALKMEVESRKKGKEMNE